MLHQPSSPLLLPISPPPCPPRRRNLPALHPCTSSADDPLAPSVIPSSPCSSPLLRPWRTGRPPTGNGERGENWVARERDLEGAEGVGNGEKGGGGGGGHGGRPRHETMAGRGRPPTCDRRHPPNRPSAPSAPPNRPPAAAPAPPLTVLLLRPQRSRIAVLVLPSSAPPASSSSYGLCAAGSAPPLSPRLCSPPQLPATSPPSSSSSGAVPPSPVFSSPDAAHPSRRAPLPSSSSDAAPHTATRPLPQWRSRRAAG